MLRLSCEANVWCKMQRRVPGFGGSANHQGSTALALSRVAVQKVD